MSKAIIKEMKTRQCIRFPQLVELYYEGGGEVPAILSGMYTSAPEALKAFEAYAQSLGKIREEK